MLCVLGYSSSDTNNNIWTLLQSEMVKTTTTPWGHKCSPVIARENYLAGSNVCVASCWEVALGSLFPDASLWSFSQRSWIGSNQLYILLLISCCIQNSLRIFVGYHLWVLKLQHIQSCSFCYEWWRNPWEWLWCHNNLEPVKIKTKTNNECSLFMYFMNNGEHAHARNSICQYFRSSLFQAKKKFYIIHATLDVKQKTLCNGLLTNFLLTGFRNGQLSSCFTKSVTMSLRTFKVWTLLLPRELLT